MQAIRGYLVLGGLAFGLTGCMAPPYYATAPAPVYYPLEKAPAYYPGQPAGPSYPGPPVALSPGRGAHASARQPQHTAGQNEEARQTDRHPSASQDSEWIDPEP